MYEMCGDFMMGFSFWICRICSLQSRGNVMHKLICFAGLWPCSALFFKFYHWWPLKSFTRVKPLRAIFIFPPFYISCNFPLYRMQMYSAKRMFSAAKHEGIKFFFLSLSFPVTIIKAALSLSFLQRFLKIIGWDRMWKLTGERVRSICLWAVSCSGDSSLKYSVSLCKSEFSPFLCSCFITINHKITEYPALEGVYKTAPRNPPCTLEHIIQALLELWYIWCCHHFLSFFSSFPRSQVSRALLNKEPDK